MASFPPRQRALTRIPQANFLAYADAIATSPLPEYLYGHLMYFLEHHWEATVARGVAEVQSDPTLRRAIEELLADISPASTSLYHFFDADTAVLTSSDVPGTAIAADEHPNTPAAYLQYRSHHLLPGDFMPVGAPVAPPLAWTIDPYGQLVQYTNISIPSAQSQAQEGPAAWSMPVAAPTGSTGSSALRVQIPFAAGGVAWHDSTTALSPESPYAYSTSSVPLPPSASTTSPGGSPSSAFKCEAPWLIPEGCKKGEDAARQWCTEIGMPDVGEGAYSCPRTDCRGDKDGSKHVWRTRDEMIHNHLMRCGPPVPCIFCREDQVAAYGREAYEMQRHRQGGASARDKRTPCSVIEELGGDHQTAEIYDWLERTGNLSFIDDLQLGQSPAKYPGYLGPRLRAYRATRTTQIAKPSQPQ